jgi:hypothetical protein
MAEVPLKVRGVREHGKSRIASSIFKYATNSFPIILRAMRDIQPLKFFGGIAALFGLLGLLIGGFVGVWYIFNTETIKGKEVVEIIHKTTPFTGLIPVASALVFLSFLMGVLALLADMLGRHRKISEEMLYLARRRVYSSKRTVRVALPPVHEETEKAASLHDSWSFPVIREVPTGPEKIETPAALASVSRLPREAGADGDRKPAHVA